MWVHYFAPLNLIWICHGGHPCEDQGFCNAVAKEEVPELGNALMQTRHKVPATKDFLREERQELIRAEAHETSEPPLSEDGFKDMTGRCCFYAADMYIRRVLADMNYEICDEGCHNGVIPFFTCTPQSTYEGLRLAIATKSIDPCPCYAPEGQCKSLGDGCPSGFYDPSAHRRRICPNSGGPAETPTTTPEPLQPTPEPEGDKLPEEGPGTPTATTTPTTTPEPLQPGPDPGEGKAPGQGPGPQPSPNSSREFIIAVDASTSVYSRGWKHHVAFIDSMMAMLTAAPEETRLMLYWFNEFIHWVAPTPSDGPVSSLSIQSSIQYGSSRSMKPRTRRRRMSTADGHRRRASTTKNQVGTFTNSSSSLTKSLHALNYTNITFPATDHGKVYEVAQQVFEVQGEPDTRKALVLITDGETWLPFKGDHKCRDMNWEADFAVKKIGHCEEANNHLCSDRNCKVDCLCGLYTAALFKDRGYELTIVGVGHQHWRGLTKSEYFKRLIETWASPHSAFYAPEMTDLPGVLPSVLAHLANPHEAHD